MPPTDTSPQGSSESTDSDTNETGVDPRDETTTSGHVDETTTGGFDETTTGDAFDDSTSSGSSSDDSDSTTSLTNPIDSAGETGETGDEGPQIKPLPLLPYSDEFNDPVASAAKWTFRHEAENEPAQFLDFTFGTPEHDIAAMIPSAGGWYNDFSGPFVYQQIHGNFMMEAYVEAHGLDDPDTPPKQDYNSAGLMIRDPASAIDNGQSNDHWILQHLGMHAPATTGVGIERKFTQASISGLDTLSGEFRGRLRLCKVGTTVMLARKLIDEDAFTITGEYMMDVDPVQAGMSLTVWNTSTANPDHSVNGDVVGEWHYVHFWKIQDLAKCLEDVPSFDNEM